MTTREPMFFGLDGLGICPACDGEGFELVFEGEPPRVSLMSKECEECEGHGELAQCRRCKLIISLNEGVPSEGEGGLYICEDCYERETGGE